MSRHLARRDWMAKMRQLIKTSFSGRPVYWRDEPSGALRPAVEAYLRGLPLAASEIAALRAYFRQWIFAEVWDRNPHARADDRALLDKLRLGVEGLTDRGAIELWLHDAAEFGLDPL